MANKTKEAAKVKLEPAAITQVAQQAIKQVADAEAAPVKKTTMSKIVSGAGKVLSNPVVSSLVSLIPGVGPVAGPLMARLGSAMSANDDEWFEKYTCAGATFNEMLGVHFEQIYDDTDGSGNVFNLYHMSGCVANIPTSVIKAGMYDLRNAEDIDSMFQDQSIGTQDPGLFYWKEQLLPTILADVRRKTGNVLNATEDDYWKAFVCAAWLYAIYYEGKKYLDLTADLPLNIPNLTKLFGIVSPKFVAQFEGIISTLGDYLRSTTSLPYAFVEYIRWRFGTMFKASNTERPGLISYDFLPPHGNIMNQATDTSASAKKNFAIKIVYPGWDESQTERIDDAALINIWTTAIDNVKACLYKTGRAIADIKLAYSDAQIRYDVNTRMFDAKENNLRCNMYQNSYSDNGSVPKNNVLLLMDGRLNAPTALQNITMSTSGIFKYDVDGGGHINVPPFPVYVPVVSLYLIGNLPGTYQDAQLVPALHDISLYDGWLSAQVEYGMVTQAHSTLHMTDTTADGFIVHYDNARPLVNGQTETIAATDTALTYAMIKGICALAARTLEFHNQRTLIEIPSYNSVSSKLVIGGYNLAYDSALVSLSQIDAIQRTAMRNLIRCEYTHKTPEGQREEVKEARNEVIEGVISEI